MFTNSVIPTDRSVFFCITGYARDVAVDDFNGYIYWSIPNKIYRNDINGSNQIVVKQGKDYGGVEYECTGIPGVLVPCRN